MITNFFPSDFVTTFVYSISRHTFILTRYSKLSNKVDINKVVSNILDLTLHLSLSFGFQCFLFISFFMR